MPKKILIVEDEAVNSIVLEKTLRELGYDIAGNAFNAEEAITLARDEKPDLILMDIRIQGEVDGIEAAKEIYALYNIPIIYLTAHSDDDTIKRAVESGPFGYLIKPFKEKELYSNIEMTIHKHKIYNASSLLNQKRIDSQTRLGRQEITEDIKTDNQVPRDSVQIDVIPKKTAGIHDENVYPLWILSTLRYPIFLFDNKGLLLYMNKACKTFFHRMGITFTNNRHLSIHQLPEFIYTIWNRNENQLRSGKHITTTGNHSIDGKKGEYKLEMHPLFKNNSLLYVTCILLPAGYNQLEIENGSVKGISQYLLSDLQTRLREIHFLASPEDSYRFRQIFIYSGEALKLLSEIEGKVTK